MDFIERLFGISPDGGSGSVEFLLLSIPILAWLLGYSYAKRFTSLAHFWLGAALMLAPV